MITITKTAIILQNGIMAVAGSAYVSAAVKAGRMGAKVLLIEWQNSVSGMSTSGHMSHFARSSRSKMYTEILTRMADMNEGGEKGIHKHA